MTPMKGNEMNITSPIGLAGNLITTICTYGIVVRAIATMAPPPVKIPALLCYTGASIAIGTLTSMRVGSYVGDGITRFEEAIHEAFEK